MKPQSESVVLVVFPTRVGVNQEIEMKWRGLISFPHPRGGEPERLSAHHPTCGVFPTRVGVNRTGGQGMAGNPMFSPPAWG